MAELVILGDLFDRWVIPTDLVPLNSFQAICDNPANSRVMDALRQLAKRGILTYVPGNHDMALSTKDPARDPAIYGDRLSRDSRWFRSQPAQRGVPQREIGGGTRQPLLPFQCFRHLDEPAVVTSHRLLHFPYGDLQSLQDRDHQKVSSTPWKNSLRTLIDSDNFVKDVFDSVARDAGLNGTDPVDMDGIAGFPAHSSGEIGSLYERLIRELEENTAGYRLENQQCSETSEISILRQSRSTFPSLVQDQNIVIFGHTHKADLRKSYILEEAPEVENIHLDLPCRSIYANCGTWVDSAPYCTYVETQEDAAAKPPLCAAPELYPTKTVLQEGFVEL